MMTTKMTHPLIPLPNAYKPWSNQELFRLTILILSGEPLLRVAAILGRQPVPLLKRAAKIGVLEYRRERLNVYPPAPFAWFLGDHKYADWDEIWRHTFRHFDWDSVDTKRKHNFLKHLARSTM